MTQKWTFDLCKDVSFSKTTLLHQYWRQCLQIKSLTPKKAEGCQFDNLTLSHFDFPKMIFLEKGQSPAICDFFRRYEDVLFQFQLFLSFLGVIDIFSLQKDNNNNNNNINIGIGCLIIIFISVLEYFCLKNGEAGNRQGIT